MPRRDKKKKKTIGWNAGHGEGLKEKSIIKGPDRRQRTGLDFHKGMKRSTTQLNTESYGSLLNMTVLSCPFLSFGGVGMGVVVVQSMTMLF